MFFDSRKLKNYIKIALKPTGVPIKIYHAVYICEKNVWHYS